MCGAEALRRYKLILYLIPEGTNIPGPPSIDSSESFSCLVLLLTN